MKDDDFVQVISPINGTALEQFTHLPEDQIHQHISTASEAFQDWKQTSFPHRANCLKRVAALLEEAEHNLVTTMALEMGKPVKAGRAEVRKCAWVCRYFADHAETFLADQTISTEPGERALVTCQPLGVIFAVMPWNFPLWQVFRFAAPTLMAGNVALLKHADNVPGCASMIESLFISAGLPNGVFTNLPIGHQGSETVIKHPDVRAVTLTGSTSAGKAVAALAGQHLKKTVLELGGSDAYLILPDADISLAAEVCAKSRLLNSGQSCIAAKRFIVIDRVLEEFQEALCAEMAKHKVGDPLDEETDIGPMARFDLRDKLREQVEESIAKGAVPRDASNPQVDKGLLAEGAYYLPKVLTGVRPGMPAFDDELFGPVASVISVQDEAEALNLANASRFGLGGAIFSRDLARAQSLARTEMDCGAVAINQLVASDPRLPFGGVKQSGYGRELGPYGIREFVNIKTITTKRSA